MAEDRSNTEDASVENEKPVGKRKRVILSCLNCKKRKVKCNKQLPCVNCRERREVHLCRYDSTPPPSESYVKLSVFTTLQDRVRQIEQHLSQSVATDTPTSLTSVTKDETHTSKSETAFLALDDLSNVTNDPDESHAMRWFSKAPRPRAQQLNGKWPNIVGQIPITQRPSRWIAAMRENLAALPDRPIIVHLVDHYFSTVDLFRHHVHESVFREELSQFLSIRDFGDPLVIDPAWLALLTSVLCVSTHSLLRCGWTNGPAALDSTHGDFYNSLSKRLDEAFENVLFCAGCLRRPQFRVLQALLIILNINQMDHPMSSFDGVLTEPTPSLWLDTAISVCQGLRLHMLGPQYERDTPPDPAFPSGQTLYAREMASRATHALAFWDQIICCLEMDERGGDQWAFRFPSNMVSTPLPRNLFDRDLWPGSNREIIDHPLSVKTEAVWELHQIQVARLWVTVSRLTRDPSSRFEDVLELDREVRQGDQDLLALRSGSAFSLDEDLCLEALHGSYQQRMLRLHRQYFLRSYGNPAYELSQNAALSAARQIIRGHLYALSQHSDRMHGHAGLVFFSHHLSATVILFVHACFTSAVRPEIREELRTSARLFQQVPPQSSFRWSKAVSQGGNIVQIMCDTLENPPTTLEDIQALLLEIRRQPGAQIATSVTTSKGPIPVDSAPSSVDELWPSLTEPVPQVWENMDESFDWDSLFRGF